MKVVIFNQILGQVADPIQGFHVMFQVLRDTTRRGHKLYHHHLADAESGKIVETDAGNAEKENLMHR